MEDLTDIFTSEMQSDEDAELVAASQVLEKIAEEQGVDISSLSDEDMADLLLMLRSGEASGNSVTEPQTKEASDNMNEMTEHQVTVADVSMELAKVASAQGIDLDGVSREEYAEAFNALAEQMSDPEYFEKRAEQQEKLAEADVIGRVMARSFMSELEDDGDHEKIARARHKIEAEKERVRRGAAPTPRGGTKNPRRMHANSGFAKMDRIAVEGKKATAKAEADEKIVGGARDKIKKLFGEHIKGPLRRASATTGHALGVADRVMAKRVGGAALGAGALGAGALGIYGARKALGTGKTAALEEFEEEALALAQAYIEERSKEAEDESYEDLVAERAAEILAENGVEI